MERFCQELNENWFVRTEAENADLESYYSRCDENLCVVTKVPATAADLFPKADTPLWFYKKFRPELTPDPDHGIYLSFDQAVCLCEAWVNGICVGKHVHSEEKFSFDVTRALKPGENLIACRVYGPVHGKIGPDGISMKTAPNFGQVYNYYTVISKTGINGRVRLIKKPLCAIDDLFVLPDPEKKSVTVTLTLKNRGESHQNAGIEFRVLERTTEIVSKSASARVGAGESEAVKVDMRFESIRLWSPDDPNLYTLSVRVKTAGEERAETRFGFKSFRVGNGWFILNGKRIWLSSAHIQSDREALLHAKAMGFKAIRFLTRMPPEELLDFCDEIGLMVYEECAVAWGMSDYPEMPSHMAAYLDNMIKRDRNHVSVCIWGIFNEQAGPCDKMRSSKLSKTSGVFDFAVGHLLRMRELDPSRLILLSSGRWDAKRSVGSFSNPGSRKWEFGWGEEAPGAPDSTLIDEGDLNPYIIGLGDVHVYPTVPISNRVRDFIRTLGRGSKPVFLSEHGVGYQLDLYALYGDLIKNSHPEHPMIPYYATQIKRLEEWIKLYSLENVYPDARGFLTASINAAAGQRRESIDSVRANPDLCGYSMTSFTVSNEGVYSSRGQLVPGVVDALRDSFAPLKWAIFTPSSVFCPGKPIEAEIVLCSEDALPAGKYEAVVSVTGPGGVAFREKKSFNYPVGSPLAATVMNVSVPGLFPGDYTVSVDAVGFEQPTCGKKKIYVKDPDAAPRPKGSLFTIGDAKRAEEILLSHGMSEASGAEKADVIAVGVTKPDEETKNTIFSLAAGGKKVFILDAGFWEKSNTSEQKFMQSIEYGSENAESVFGECVYVRNWLYHLDSYAADSKAFKGLTDVGILDMELFREIYPDHYLINTAKPQKTYCASFGSGIFAKDGCMAALTAGRFSFGKGSVTVSTFKILENLGSDPAADILLLNLFAAD